jgi:hypothetical protein
MDLMTERQKRFNDALIKHLSMTLNQMQTSNQTIQSVIETFAHRLTQGEQQDIPFTKSADLFYRCQYSLVDFPKTCTTGDTVHITIEISNRSLQPWPVDGEYPVRLAYSWCKDADQIPVNAPRVSLQNNIKPGQSTQIPIRCITPNHKGTYHFSCDLVREGIAWFHTFNGSFLSTIVHVT